MSHVIEMRARGIGRVYKTTKENWIDILFMNRGTMINAYYPGVEISRCDRTTCLQCPKLSNCIKYICLSIKESVSKW